ncbi:translation initiation factor IF-6 [Candidatus Micrarchaeota archaeon]|nr:translation initiation factor IF-6 [Candidatus Micrarchaeota archaeon]
MNNKTAYFGNPWIGMFIKTNDHLSLLPLDSMEKLDRMVSGSLQTETAKVGIGDSNLLGIYVAMNSNGVVLPNIIKKEEAEEIRRSGLNVCVSADKHNAHGNNMVVNDNGGIINPGVSKKEIKAMEDVLGVELVPGTVAGYSTVGSACLATNHGFLAHYRTSEDEMKRLGETLKVYGSKGTVNTGTGFVSYGIVVNKSGYVAGEQTTAFEMGRAEEALGLIK